MTAQLRLATIQELSEREDLLKKHLGPSTPILLSIQTKLRYFSTCTQLIYIPSSGKHQRSIIIITKAENVIKPSSQSLNGWWDRDVVSDDDLRCFLRVIPEWNWNKPFILQCSPNPFGGKLCEIFSEEEFSGKSLHAAFTTGGLMMTLSKEDIPHVSLPPGFKKDKLHPCHMPFVFSKWFYSKFYDLDLFQNNIESLPSVAIFREEDDIMISNPVCSVQLYKFGLIGTLFTDEKYRNLGLASYATIEIAKIVTDKGIIAAIWIVEGNDSSVNFHLKKGYKEVANGSGWTHFVDKSITMEDYLSINE